ncbi:hypothetical protein [Bacillus thuringiensis]|uniref:hypothetical protein n=1 Tax=Bacillus thuringiensis TaxID=1428 RepID=UPI00159BB88E|nr:hypothetical protein [Bacillus thuringiensis]
MSRIQQAISSNEELSRKFEEFIVNEISNGKNIKYFYVDQDIRNNEEVNSLHKIYKNRT